MADLTPEGVHTFFANQLILNGEASSRINEINTTLAMLAQAAQASQQQSQNGGARGNLGLGKIGKPDRFEGKEGKDVKMMCKIEPDLKEATVYRRIAAMKKEGIIHDEKPEDGQSSNY